ncbi:MAG: hypothetical protein NW216_11340 [Hyphomicrobium sp.]|nr:hypothetical protein [Hyphomicrobium sp.]
MISRRLAPQTHRRLLAALSVATVACAMMASNAAVRAESIAAAGPEAAKKSPVPSTRHLADTFCRVVIDAAVAGKLAEEKRKAEILRSEIEARIGDLEKAIEKHETWLAKRNDFQDKATANLVEVYARMDTDAAAERLSAIDDGVAAAILVKLPPKSASAVLGAMQADRAGRLTAFMAGSAEIERKTAASGGATP